MKTKINAGFALMAFLFATLAWLPSAHAQQPCQAGFVYTVTPGPGGYVVNLYDSSWTAGTITNWQWSLGNGTAASGPNPVVTYQSPGIYGVCLTITAVYQNQTCTSTICDTVFVNGGAFSCNAGFNFSVNGNTATFTNTSTNTGPNPDYYWTFGDGSTSWSVNPAHTYSTAGTYQVCLMLIDSSSGCSDVYCQNVTISTGGNPCQASFVATATPSGGVVFSNTSTGNPTQYFWSFGDGSTSTAANPTHNYNAPGYYNVCLTISNPGTTCQSTWCDSIYVNSSTTCIADFGYNSIGGTAFAFNNNSTSIGINPYYYWDFGDGTSSWAASPIHTFPAPGTYQVCLMLIDSSNNCWDTYCQTITVQGTGGCSSNYAIYPDSIQSHTYWAYNLATGVGPLTYLWSWGDGTSSTGAYPSHTYAGPGLYTICLTITDATGCTSNTCYQWQLLRMTNAPVTINVIGGTTGIEEPKAGTISVFPNPAAGQMNVSLTNNTGQTATLELYNLEGRRVADFGTVNGQDINMTLNLDQVPAGMYFLRVAAGNWMEHLKVVVK